jgi:hypothetical protein
MSSPLAFTASSRLIGTAIVGDESQCSNLKHWKKILEDFGGFAVVVCVVSGVEMMRYEVSS